MHAVRARLCAPRASACGIPASTLLSALGRDRAYSYLDACTVHRVPFHDVQRAGETDPGFALVQAFCAAVFSFSLRKLITFSYVERFTPLQ
jgi:hypothetical protein